jgi:hypothetical protein
MIKSTRGWSIHLSRNELEENSFQTGLEVNYFLFFITLFKICKSVQTHFFFFFIVDINLNHNVILYFLDYFLC